MPIFTCLTCARPAELRRLVEEVTPQGGGPSFMRSIESHEVANPNGVQMCTYVYPPEPEKEKLAAA